MENLAIIIGLLGTGFMLSYIGNQFKSSSEGGTKYSSVMKVLFNSFSFFSVLTVPFASLAVAENNNLSNLAGISEALIVIVGFLMIVYVFFLLWSYLSDILRLVSGSKSEFTEEKFD